MIEHQYLFERLLYAEILLKQDKPVFFQKLCYLYDHDQFKGCNPMILRPDLLICICASILDDERSIYLSKQSGSLVAANLLHEIYIALRGIQ